MLRDKKKSFSVENILKDVRLSFLCRSACVSILIVLNIMLNENFRKAISDEFIYLFLFSFDLSMDKRINKTER